MYLTPGLFIIESLNYLGHFRHRVQLLRQLMSGKDNAAKADDSLRTNYLVVCYDLGQLTVEATTMAKNCGQKPFFRLILSRSTPFPLYQCCIPQKVALDIRHHLYNNIDGGGKGRKRNIPK